MFTEQHYKEIAKVLRIEEIHKPFYRELCVTSSHTGMVQNFIELFEKDNKKFSKRKFLEAIYNKEEVEEI